MSKAFPSAFQPRRWAAFILTAALLQGGVLCAMMKSEAREAPVAVEDIRDAAQDFSLGTLMKTLMVVDTRWDAILDLVEPHLELGLEGYRKLPDTREELEAIWTENEAEITLQETRMAQWGLNPAEDPSWVAGRLPFLGLEARLKVVVDALVRLQAELAAQPSGERAEYVRQNAGRVEEILAWTQAEAGKVAEALDSGVEGAQPSRRG